LAPAGRSGHKQASLIADCQWSIARFARAENHIIRIIEGGVSEGFDAATARVSDQPDDRGDNFPGMGPALSSSWTSACRPVGALVANERRKNNRSLGGKLVGGRRHAAVVAMELGKANRCKSSKRLAAALSRSRSLAATHRAAFY
jgi:hypothetical protein